ncbi:MAG: HD domain-containing protein [Thermoplasmata archaeon]
MNEVLLSRIKERVKSRLGCEKKQSVAHRWGHVLRVERNALKIASHYKGVNLDALLLASVLHDIDQPFDKKREHAKASANLARKILKEEGADDDLIELVARIIEEHSSEDLDLGGPKIIESKILFDADKLDGLGAIGIARAFAYKGQCGVSPEDALSWYENKIKISEKNLQTDEGKRRAKELISYTNEFISRFKSEI